MARALWCQERYRSKPISSRISCHAVAYRRSRGQRKVNDAKGNTQTSGSFLGYQLAYAGDLKGRLFDGFTEHLKISTSHPFQSHLHNARAADTYIDNGVSLCNAVECTCIKGLSSGALQNTTSLAQPKESFSFVASAVSVTIRPISSTASIFRPVFVEPTLTELQIRSV